MARKPRVRKPVTCERCGRLYSSRSASRSHERVCQEIPVPEALALEFANNDGDSVEWMAAVYGVSREFIKSHLVLAGVPIEEIEARWDNSSATKRGSLPCDECGIYVFPSRKTMPKHWQWHVNGLVEAEDKNLCVGCAKDMGYD